MGGAQSSAPPTGRRSKPLALPKSGFRTSRYLTSRADLNADSWSRPAGRACSRGVMRMNASEPIPAEAVEVVADWVADAAAQDGKDKFLGKRQTLRYVWPATMEVLVNARTSRQQRVLATGIDVSEDGMALRARHGLPVGEIVFVRYADDTEREYWVPAEVRYSKRSINGYRIGLRFRPSHAT